MVDIDEIRKKMIEIQSGVDMDFFIENMPFALQILKVYDKENDFNKKRFFYQFLIQYFLNYIAKKYNQHFSYDLDANIDSPANYCPNDNKINFSSDNIAILLTDSEELICRVFHEFRHKLQTDDINASKKDLLSLDPAAILFLKELIMVHDKPFYNRNHSSYIIENDANLFALSEAKKILTREQVHFFEKIKSNTLNNYVGLIMSGLPIYEYDYRDKRQLPIIYQTDYEFKNFMSKNKIDSNSLLGLFYYPNGKPKSYQELLNEEQKIVENCSKEQSIIEVCDSTTDFEKKKISVKEHIHKIFQMIIKSDPILTIQEELHFSNSKIRCDNVKKILINCPTIIDIYENEITSILEERLANGNRENIVNMINQLGNEKLILFVKRVLYEQNLSKSSKPYIKPNVVEEVKDRDSIKEVMSTSVTREELLRQKQILENEKKRRQNWQEENQQITEEDNSLTM